MKIYISGKITGLDMNEVAQNFEFAEAHLLNKGLEPVNPIKEVEGEGKSWQECMLADIELIFNCEAIYMLSNWQDSKGAKIERAIAEHLGLQIHYQGTL